MQRKQELRAAHEHLFMKNLKMNQEVFLS